MSAATVFSCHPDRSDRSPAGHRLSSAGIAGTVLFHGVLAGLLVLRPSVPPPLSAPPVTIRMASPAASAPTEPNPAKPSPPMVRPAPKAPAQAAPPRPSDRQTSPTAPAIPAVADTETRPAQAATPAGPTRTTTTGQASATPARFDADYLNNPAPAYPSASRRLGEEGKVMLRVFVDTEGRAGQIEIETGSGFARLDRAAREAVGRWKFVPARRGSETVGAWVLVPVVFSLKG